MRRGALIVILALSVQACAQGGPAGGYVSYDVLAQMQKDCQAKGGNLKRRAEGDPTWIGGWACERK